MTSRFASKNKVYRNVYIWCIWGLKFWVKTSECSTISVLRLSPASNISIYHKLKEEIIPKGMAIFSTTIGRLNFMGVIVFYTDCTMYIMQLAAAAAAFPNLSVIGFSLMNYCIFHLNLFNNFKFLLSVCTYLL